MERQVTAHNFFIRFLLCIASGLSFVVYLFVYRMFRYRYAVIIDNLSKSFPERSQSEIAAYARNYYRHLGDLVIEQLLFIVVDGGTRKRLANYTNIELLDGFYKQGKNVVTLASHCGNWEYLINLPKIQGFRTYTAYTPLSSKVIDRYILKMRSMFGVNLIPKKYFFRGALAALRARGEPSMVVVIADQRPAPGSGKHFVQFLNRPTHVQIGAERLAESSGATVLFLECVKKSRFHYDYTFHVVTENAKGCTPMEITETYYHMLEENIGKFPSHWLWSHNRWKPLLEPQVGIVTR
ncbi:lysophospholipid acyltransferase family protein [Dyadobacter sp. LHD-138]|uniref:lysophospholipid acyltransferase family protein n=1 Tax=Dyadobacter sp. LHD-138 TaxID=3071413 RepID=UPI0027E04792|nr:lysophospholipid acyltransferase family protein [Dyadobacter sp. LHD-138]MDQ6482034.1 lysophospholipid acyltransferase family protein [Dyadobacter sp. LHD-138]